MITSLRLAGKCLAASTLVTGVSGLAYVGLASASPTPNITTVAGKGTPGYSGDGGPAVNAQLFAPTGLSQDLSGALYIGDTANNRVRKVVNPTTINTDTITTFAGNGTNGFSGDGGPATAAELSIPTGTAVDGHGNVFIADTGNNRVREVSAGLINTVAGNGTCTKTGPSGDGGPAKSASLCHPTGVAVDSGGNLYISDTGHNEVRIVSSSGTINDFAGTGKCGSSGDGGAATKAKVCAETGLGLDATGNLFIADTGNSTIREVATTTGKISTFAGMPGQFGYSGDGGPANSAKLAAPTGVSVSSLGVVLISDTLNNRIRQVQSGTISTYAGNGTAGFSGDNGPATSAELNGPTGSMAMDGTALFFSDTGNNRVRGVFNGVAPILPDSSLAIALPLTALALIGGTAGFLRLRHRRQISGSTA